MIIILTSGKQGSGKTTLKRNLLKKYPDLISLRFAEPLYQMHDACRQVLKDYAYEPYDYETKDGDLLQLLGTEWGRKKDSQIWVKLLLNQLRMLPPDSMVTVEDCRFENEFDAFMNVPGVISVRLEASRATRMARAEMWRKVEDHASEVGLDHYAAMRKFDMVLDADKHSQEEIARMVAERIEQMKTTVPR